MEQSLNTIEVVAAIITHNNYIFVTQRGYGEFKDGWEFPGGKIEHGETPKQALVREIKEELDTEIKVGELIDIVEYDYPKFHLTMYCFWCTIKSGNLVLKEHEAAKWLTKETLDSVNWLPADKGLIEKIKRGQYNYGSLGMKQQTQTNPAESWCQETMVKKKQSDFSKFAAEIQESPFR